MTRATLLAFAAGGCGVVGAWDVLGALQRAPALAWIASAARPLSRAQREGRAPTVAEQRQLALLVSGCLVAGGWLVGGFVLGVLAGVTGPLLAGALVTSRRRAYRARLAAGAAPTARALAAALGAGRSVHGALADAAASLDGAERHELAHAAAELAAGHPTDLVLERLRERAGSRAWDTLVAAILLQRAAGGDLPGLLRDLAAAQEAASRTDQDARTVTAQARFTARLVAGLPAVALGLAELASPGFAGSLLGNPLSLVLVVLAVMLQATALVLVRGITRKLAAP